MRNRPTVLAATTLVLAILPISARAEYFNDKPNKVIVNDQNVYFTTDRLCLDWCMLSPSWAAGQRDKAFSVLLTATAQGKSVIFFNGACELMPVYAEPGLVMFTH